MALTLNGSTGLSGIVGSAATPALQGTDTNTGYFFGTDILGLSTAGSERLRITAAGNLALGNDGSFPIYTDANDRNFILGTGSDDVAIQLHSGTDKYGGVYFGDATSGSDRWNGYVEYKHDDNYLRFATGSSEKIRITSDGRLLVGATAATNSSIAEFSKSVDSGAAGCHITVENTSTNSVNNTAGIHLKTDQGVAKFFTYRATETYLQSRAGGTSDLLLYADGASKMRFYTDGNERVQITSGGDINIHNRTAASSTDPVTLDFGGQYTPDASITHQNLKVKLFSNASSNDSGGFTMGQSGVSYVSSVGAGHLFYTAPSALDTLIERLRITYDGKIGIKTTDPKGIFDIQSCGSDGVPAIALGANNSASTGTTRTDGTDKAVRVGCVHQTNAEQPFGIFYAVAGASNHNTINYGGGTSWMNAATRHEFYTAADTITTAGTKKMTIHQGGDVEIIDGNLKVASTHGIDFSATGEGTGSGTSMDSELLDDYERGTWGSINTGADSCTFSHNWYVKVGRLVTCNVRLSGITNGNANALTLNLPFANGTVEASGSFSCDTFNMPSDWVQMVSYAYDQKLYILCSRDNAGWENLLGNQTANNSTLIMNITYLANS